MCLAVPAKILDIRGDTATVDVSGNTVQASILLTPGVDKGDYVLIHAGYALDRINASEAIETLQLLEVAHAAPAE